jgi:hypothetical protein
MSGAMHHPDAKQSCVGVKNMSFSFNTNGTSNPTVSGTSTTLRGGEPVKSITRTAVGTFLITLNAGYYYRYDIGKTADLEAIASPDGAYATISAITGVGTSTGNITITVTTHAAGGTVTDFGTGGTGVARRLSVFIDWKDSSVGT